MSKEDQVDQIDMERVIRDHSLLTNLCGRLRQVLQLIRGGAYDVEAFDKTVDGQLHLLLRQRADLPVPGSDEAADPDPQIPIMEDRIQRLVIDLRATRSDLAATRKVLSNILKLAGNPIVPTATDIPGVVQRLINDGRLQITNGIVNPRRGVLKVRLKSG